MPQCPEFERLYTMLAFERQGRALGYQKICGIDEAGRGPLAGPVVAAACVLPEKVYSDPLIFRKLDDSKKLTPKVREELFQFLTTYPGIEYSIGMACHEEIDSINILQATILAMTRAVLSLKKICSLLLVDGLKLPEKNNIPCWKIIKGDQLSLSIAAASILAKVTRDRLMIQHHELWPEYGFDQHKGYGTPKHLEALALFGPCSLHRKTYAPVAGSMSQA